MAVHAFYRDIRLFAQAEDNLPQKTDRSAVTDNVQITYIGSPIRIDTVEILGAVIIENTASRLAQIIITGPRIVTQHMVIVLHDIPKPHDVGGEGLRAHHRFVGMQFPLQHVTAGQIIQSGNIHALAGLLDTLRHQRMAGEGICRRPYHQRHHAV